MPPQDISGKGWTPAPWRYDGRNLVGSDGSRVTFSGHIGLSIAPHPKGWPNDHLLLAAPALYEALRDALGALRGYAALAGSDHIQDMIRDHAAAALSLAHGEQP